MTRPEKDRGASMAAVYGEHALHQLRATHVREGERLRAGTAVTAALNMLQNDLKAEPVYTHSHCETDIWFTTGQALQKRHLRSVSTL